LHLSALRGSQCAEHIPGPHGLYPHGGLLVARRSRDVNREVRHQACPQLRGLQTRQHRNSDDAHDRLQNGSVDRAVRLTIYQARGYLQGRSFPGWGKSKHSREYAIEIAAKRSSPHRSKPHTERQKRQSILHSLEIVASGQFPTFAACQLASS
jgi:hypothetical protein